MQICDNFNEEQKAQFNILENSEVLLTVIIIGSLMRLMYINMQKNQLVNSVLCPKTNESNSSNGFCIQLVSSLLVIYGLFGFYNQSINIARASSKEGSVAKEQCMEITLSEVVILVSLIRLYMLFLANDNANASVRNQEILELDETVE